jgi:putative FmdB family regulatory protein
MPIYEYVCRACGTERDVMQKISDAPLTTCPQCAAEAFEKKVSAAGFQLKGGGWYVTDFRGDSKKGNSGSDSGADKSSDKTSTESTPANAPSTGSDSASAAPATAG